MPKDLTSFFSPNSVAVIGASRSPEKVGAVVLKNIIDSKFSGKIYPINPNSSTISNLTCYPDVQSLPEVPDLAIIALPVALILDTLTKIGEKGIKNAVIFAAGFKETGAEGAQLEKQLIETANKLNIQVLGPNCMGFVNNLRPINATFGEQVQQPGNLRFVTQSGAIASGLFDWCKSTGLGFSDFVTLGNKAVINENDVLDYFLQHPTAALSPQDQEGLSDVHPIGLYLESITQGNDFLKITHELSKKDPVFIIKPGKSTAAAKAMQSHTGAIAGEDAVLAAALKQSRVIRCATLEDFFDLSRGFSWEKAPEGPKVAIISNAGGPGVISADAVISEGLELAEFNDETKKHLENVLPRAASVFNPVDVLGDALADRFASAIDVVLENNEVHALVVILTPQLMTQIEKTAENIGAMSKKHQKPIFCSFIGGNLVVYGEQKLNEYRIPSFRFPERAIAVIGQMWKWKQRMMQQEEQQQQVSVEINAEKIKEILTPAKNNNQKTLDNISANELIKTAGIQTPGTQIVTTIDEAKTFAQGNNYPVVLKLSSPGLLHKKDIGGVIANILTEDALATEWNNIKLKSESLPTDIKEHVKIQIQKDITNGFEVIVGVKRDPTFGLTLLFGAGGTYAELIADRNLHLLPMDYNQAKKLVEQSKVYTILKGFRGEPAYALDKLYDLIVRLGKLAVSLPDVSEIEINPVIVTLNDVWAIDAKVVLIEGEHKTPTLSHFHTATTTEATNLAGTYHYFTFEAETPLNLKPGQYVNIKVSNERMNCYSVDDQSSPTKFGLLIDTSPGGPGSKFFENLKVGDKISYMGPFGMFTLKPDDGSTHMLFLGTGSGLSPLRAMIDSALKEQHIQTQISLYFGLRYESDIFWKDYFEQLEKEYPNFHYKLCLSKPDENWQGLKGHNTDVLCTDFPDTKECSVYLCGSKGMIEQASQMMLEKGCPKERIYSEKF